MMKKFNKDKYLKKLRFKKYKRYLYIGIPCLLVLLIGIYFAYSKFSVFKEKEVVRTTVGDFISGDIVITPYIDGKYSDMIPGKNDGYAVDKIVCDNDTSASWNNASWGIMVTNLTKRTKCNVYFKKSLSKVQDIITQLDTSSKCPAMNQDGSVTVTIAKTTEGYLCKAKDAYGDSYYYRGNVTNNYVKFAGLYWRIVRINGDGSVRVVYDGTSAHANGEASEDRQIGKSAFNGKHNDNAYVGYMYGKIGSSTYAETHSNINDSIIKTYLDTWYENNIKGTINEQYLTDNIFCNDRSFASNNNGTGVGTSTTYYRWSNFANNTNNKKLLLICLQKNDAFTVSDIINGNGALTYPIGLLSSDEIVLAGGWSVSNNNYYLYSGQNWWASSPNNFVGTATIRRVNSDGNADDNYYTNFSYGVRPVLNLKPEVLKLGTGTMDDPYHL